MDGWRIGELARQAGVGVETVRFYERRGLLPEPPRTPAGYRRYPTSAAERLRFIRRAKELGFSLAEIDELLTLRRSSDEPCADVQRRIAAKLANLEERLRDLERVRGALQKLYSRCQTADSLGDCPLLDLLEGGGR